MKQKLLFSLLALLVSVGVVSAQFSVTPADGQTVTVTRSGGTDWLADDFSGVTNVTYVSGTKITIAGGAATISASLGGEYTGLEFSGKATVISVTTAVEKIEVKNNGELTSLTIPSSVTSLSCPGNKLTVIPKKGSLSAYNVGTQTPNNEVLTGLAEGDQKPANKPLDLTIDKIGGLNTIAANADKGAYTYGSWSLAGSSYGASYPKTDASAPYRYYFMTGSMTSPGTYMDGDYKFNITFADSHPDYPGVTIAGVPVKVLSAVFTLGETTVSPDVNPAAGSVLIYKGGSLIVPGVTDGVSKGDQLTYIPQAGTGYTFSSFTPVGMTLVQSSITSGSDSRVFEVSGTVTPSMTATFKGEDNSITYTQNHTGGTLKVYNNATNALISSGTNIASGTTIRIEATPNTGYKVAAVSDLTLNAEAITGAAFDEDGKGKNLIATYTVQGVPMVLNIQFTVSSARELTLRYLTAAISSLTVNTESGSSKIVDTDYKEVTFDNIELNSQPNIKLVTNVGYSITSLTANGSNVSFTHTSTDDANKKTYVVTGYTMPNTEVLMVVNTSELSIPTITVPENQKLVYNGSGQKIDYETDPVGLTNVKVEYKVTASGNDETYSTNLFVNANTSGSYTARISRATDGVYDAPKIVKSNGTDVWTKGEVAFEIVAATPKVTTVPTVTIEKEGGNYVYKVSGGSVTYKDANGKDVTVPGSSNLWQVVKVGGSVDLNTSHTIGAGNISVPLTVPEGNPTAPETHLVSVRFTAMTSSTAANTNFNQVAVVADAVYDKKATASVNIEVLSSKMPKGTKLALMNGTQVLGSTVKSGTLITFVPEFDPLTYTAPKIYQVDAMGEPVGAALDETLVSGEATTKGFTASGTKMYFAIVADAANDLRKEVTIKTAIDNTKKYDGSAKYFDPETIVLQDKYGATINATDNSNIFPKTGWKFTYKNASGTTVVSPVEAGSYSVTMSRDADVTNDASHFKAISGTGTLVIKKDTPVVVSWPEVAYVATGQKLSAALFDGGQPAISGSFAFVDGTITPSTGVAYAIKFIPDDTKNYEELIAPDDKKIIPTEGNKRVLVITTPVNGSITVVGSNGVTYNSGTEIPSTVTYLKITATPTTGYTLTSLLVNDTEFTSGNNYTLSSTANGPISVKATFSNASSYKVDIIVPRGVQLVSKSGTTVAAGKDFTFTLATAAGDVPRVVDEDGEVIEGEAGVYTLEKVMKEKTITVTLSSPTELTVKVTQTPTGNGVIEVENLSGLRADTYYYGDTLRLTATMKDDYRLLEWWDGSEENPRLFVVTEDVEISASFKYTVGIEPIEGMEVRGGEGYIYVSAPGEVTVTVVNMSGRAQKVRVNGEEYIRELPAGIYGVVVEQGNKASRAKVVVR